MSRAGFDPAAPVFLAGHSLGSWGVQVFAQKYPSAYAGIIMLGGTAQRDQGTQLLASFIYLLQFCTKLVRFLSLHG